MDLNVYQHFRSDERPFIDSIQDWLIQVERQYAPYLTDFLDPRQAYILETIIRQTPDICFQFFGGFEAAERVRCLIYPDYYQVQQEDFEISLFEINYPKKFASLSHGSILGSLLGSGIKRESFGDIISDGERWQLFLADEVKHYIQLQLTKIGSVSIHLEERRYTDIIMPQDGWVDEQLTVSSLRLDNVISSVFNISRQRSKQLVESGAVKLNWVESTRPDLVLDLLDIVSVRKFGRIQLRSIEGKTKKQKIRLGLGVLRK